MSLSSMITNFSLVGGVLAIAISFDTINNERQKGSLKTLLSYPIYRDSIVYGKYLGGLIAVTLVATITFLAGIGVFVSVTGLAMTMDTVVRLLIFFGVSLVYMAIFLAVGLLLSIVLPLPSTSLLASMIVWLSSIQLIPNIGYAIGQILYPVRFSLTNGRPIIRHTDRIHDHQSNNLRPLPIHSIREHSKLDTHDQLNSSSLAAHRR